MLDDWNILRLTTSSAPAARHRQCSRFYGKFRVSGNIRLERATVGPSARRRTYIRFPAGMSFILAYLS
jgi:hypothetical protein